MKQILTSIAAAVAFSHAGACTLDLMTVYTPAAITSAGSQSALIAKISSAISQINTAFSNSGLLHSVVSSNVYFAANGGTWGTTADDVLPKLQIDVQVRAQRNASHSDAVIAVIGDSAGKWGLTLPNSEIDRYYSFAVVQQQPMVAVTGTYPGYTYAHEFGHIMGLRHQWAGGVSDNDMTGYTLGHGYFLALGGVGAGQNCMHTLLSLPSLGLPCNSGTTDARALLFANPSVVAFSVAGSSPFTVYDPDGSYVRTAPTNVMAGNSTHSNEASVINSVMPNMCNFGLSGLKIPQLTSMLEMFLES